MKNKKQTFNGMYRGIIVDNSLGKGQCKIYVPHVYSEAFKNSSDKLPTAEPVMPLINGGTGVNDLNYDVMLKKDGDGRSKQIHNKWNGQFSTPHNGTNVWVFFENGDWHLPKFFGVTSGGESWQSQHNNQKTIITDNVKISIDDNPNNSSNTFNKSDSYNTECTEISKQDKLSNKNCRVKIEIIDTDEDAFGLDLSIIGNVNLHVEGNIYEEHSGDKHETLLGDLYRYHKGDIHYVQEGDTVIDIIGDQTSKIKGNDKEIRKGDRDIILEGNKSEIIHEENELTVKKANKFNFLESCTQMIKNIYMNIIEGNKQEDIAGNDTKTIAGYRNINLNGTNINESLAGKYTITAGTLIENISNKTNNIINLVENTDVRIEKNQISKLSTTLGVDLRKAKDIRNYEG